MQHRSLIATATALVALATFATTAHADLTSGNGGMDPTLNSGGDTQFDLLWHDEFDGFLLDSTKWTDRRLGPRREGVNVSDAVTVADGNLSIRTYTQNGTHYTGMIGTQETFQHTYGYYEARINFDGSSGMWQNFWLQSPDVENTSLAPEQAGVELDVVEHLSHENGWRDVASVNTHWGGYGSQHQTRGTNVYGLDLDQGFHTYGLLWTPEGYTWYIDGNAVWDGNDTPISQRDQYLILASEVGETHWTGAIPNAGYGSFHDTDTVMEVDYVRVWNVSSSTPEPTSLLGLAGAGLLALRRRR